MVRKVNGWRGHVPDHERNSKVPLAGLNEVPKGSKAISTGRGSRTNTEITQIYTAQNKSSEVQTFLLKNSQWYSGETKIRRVPSVWERDEILVLIRSQTHPICHWFQFYWWESIMIARKNGIPLDSLKIRCRFVIFRVEIFFFGGGGVIWHGWQNGEWCQGDWKRANGG